MERLDHEMCFVSEVYLRDLRLVLATFTLKSVVSEIGNGNETTEVTNMDSRKIKMLDITFHVLIQLY